MSSGEATLCSWSIPQNGEQLAVSWWHLYSWAETLPWTGIRQHISMFITCHPHLLLIISLVRLQKNKNCVHYDSIYLQKSEKYKSLQISKILPFYISEVLEYLLPLSGISEMLPPISFKTNRKLGIPWYLFEVVDSFHCTTLKVSFLLLWLFWDI